jgi:hypothetical protein
MKIGEPSHPQGPKGLHELFSLLITPGMVEHHAQTFKVFRNATGHNVDIHPATADLIQRRHHLSQQSGGDEPRPDGDEEANPARDCGQGRGHGPGFGQ